MPIQPITENISSSSIVANVLCLDIVVSEFELYLWDFVYFQATTFGNLRKLPSTPGMREIVPLRSFYKDCFGIH